MARISAFTSSEIRERTEKCTDRFNECLAYQQLRKHQWLETGRAEFNLWSLGLNASRSDRSSLDYKVRQRPDLQEIITDLLDGLDESLSECLDPELAELIDNSAGVLSPEDNLENPQHFSVFNIKAILKQLTRLHIAIRKAGTQLRHHKADANLKYVLEHDNNGLGEFRGDMTKEIMAGLKEFRDDMTEEIMAGLECWDRKKGLPKPWENANRKLVERFVNANIRRRNRIFFATEKKREKKDRQVGVIKAPEPTGGKVEGPKEREKKPEGTSKTGESESTMEPPVDPLARQGRFNEESQEPTATSTIPLHAVIEQAPSKVAGTTITKATGIAQNQDYPSRPKWPESSTVPHIDCPYCSEPLTEEYTKNQMAWNGHVSGDLLPYICFIDDCKNPDDLYRTSEELTKHILSEHGLTCWICDECTPDKERERFDIFQTAQNWREHLLEAHLRTIPDAQFSKLAELSTHKMVPPIKCPLCDYATLEIKPNIDPEITRHIHEFSMRALPWEARAEGNRSEELLTGKSSNASTNNSRKRREKAMHIEDMPDPNHEEMKPTTANPVVLERIFSSLFFNPAASRHLQPDLPLSVLSPNLDSTSCELLLPIVVQLQYNLKELVDFETPRDKKTVDHTHESQLLADLTENVGQSVTRLSHLLKAFSMGGRNASVLFNTESGKSSYILQWRSLLEQDFIPGDPEYGQSKEDQEITLTMQNAESDPRAPIDSKHAPWVVPFERNPRFTGRETQLSQLEGKLFSNDCTTKVAIVGLGGVGKTQLALELLFRTAEKQPDCSMLWIPAINFKSLHQAYVDVAQQLGIAGWDDDKADVKRLVQEYLSKESTGRWLLVFDNADDMDMWVAKAGPGLQPLMDYLPESKQGTILFTTRDKRIAVKLAQQNVVEVPTMEVHAAAQLLEICLVDPNLVNSQQDKGDILSQLTYLPLAIVQAAAYINKNRISLADYLSLLEGQEEEVINLLSEEFEDHGGYCDMKNPVATTWLISFEQIRRHDLLAANYLSIMACVEPKDIPTSLLPPGTSQIEIDAMGTLDAYSFITRRPADQALDLHRLVHLATRNWLRRGGVLAQLTKEAIVRLGEVLPDYEHENRILWRKYLPHVDYVLGSILVDQDDKDRAALLWRLGMYLYQDGRWDKAESAFSEVTEARKRVLGAEHPDTLTSMANLASTYGNQRRWNEAEELEAQVTEIRKRVLGAKHPDTLTSTANLASIYRNQGKWGAIEELEVEAALQRLEEVPDITQKDHPDQANPLHNLGAAYNDGYQKTGVDFASFNPDVIKAARICVRDYPEGAIIYLVSKCNPIQLLRQACTLNGQNYHEIMSQNLVSEDDTESHSLQNYLDYQGIADTDVIKAAKQYVEVYPEDAMRYLVSECNPIQLLSEACDFRGQDYHEIMSQNLVSEDDRQSQLSRPTTLSSNLRSVLASSSSATLGSSRPENMRMSFKPSGERVSAEDLARDLRELKWEWPLGSNSYFIPINEIENRVEKNPGAVRTALYDINPDLDENRLDSLTSRICTAAPRLFSLLLLLLNTLQPTVILDIIEEDVTDKDLPLVRIYRDKGDGLRDPRGHTLGRKNHANCALNHHKDCGIMSLDSLKQSEIEDLSRGQWLVLAPIFESDPGVSMPKHYVLESAAVLPYIEDQENDEGAVRFGGYCEVWGVRIHPAHQRMLRSNDPSGPLIAVRRVISRNPETFQRENDMLSKLALKNDPHLIKLLATYRFKGHYHFLFLYAKLSLRQYWAQNPVLPWERGKVLWTIEQFLGLASALDVIHEFKSVPLPRSDYEDDQVSRGRSISTGMDYRREERFGRHGDLKPENVLWFNDQARTNNPLGILQIAGFSQGRFHQLESRSRQDPRTINGSPTYIPPELVLDRLVSRAYDIWSFGCLSLEFITWMLDGDSGVQNFSEARHVQAHDGLFDDTFYSLYNSKAGKFCEVRPGVTNWIQKLRRHQRCSQMIRDLLDLIEDRMLRVDSDDRIRSGELKACLNNILQRGQSNITYLLG